MRILVLTNMYPPHAYGGYEYLCRDAAERWQAQGHDVVVLTSTVRVAGAEEVSPGVVPVWRSLQLYWDDHVILRPPPWRRLRWELGNKRVLDRVIDEFRPDVVSAWAMGATSLGLLSRAHRRGLPVVLVLADEWPVYGPALDGWLRMFARRRLAGRVAQALTGLPTLPPRLDTIGPACFASDALRTAVRARSPWSFPNSTVVHLGIETREFAAAGQRGLDAGSETASASGGSPPVERPWQWKLLYVGRIDRRKGIDVAVRALALCPPAATLSIVGRGDDEVREELAQLATELGLADRVTFDHVPRDELAAVYRAADAFIFPPTWEEPFGLVPLEAMA
ncbi:MAG TPA: glycosyltransferase, partial [Acidimicrobiales bacterium]|nr:glycosyltransferase [Acidimicrobiales bacterium]